MLSISKFQLLCLLASRTRSKSQCQSIQGLTLLELLVVIVIIGILAAISSSTFLNAVARAQESEAKVNVGALLRAQQTHYTEQGKFANTLNDLGLGISSLTKHYEYRTHRGGVNNLDQDGNSVNVLAIAIAMPRTDVRGYMGKTWLDPFDEVATVKSVACEGGIRATYFMNNKTYCN